MSRSAYKVLQAREAARCLSEHDDCVSRRILVAEYRRQNCSDPSLP